MKNKLVKINDHLYIDISQIIAVREHAGGYDIYLFGGGIINRTSSSYQEFIKLITETKQPPEPPPLTEIVKDFLSK